MTAIVIGAGPAGLSAAIGLRKAGLKVQLFEQRRQWQGRVCGAFLSPEAVAHLEWLGVIRAIQEKAVLVISSEVTFGDNKYAVPIGESGRPALGVSREDLETILMNEALRLKVDVKIGVRFNSKENIDDQSLFVLAAGRFASSAPQEKLGWFGWNATFKNVRQNPGEMSLHFYPHGYVGVLTFADGTTNVCGLYHRRSEQRLEWEEIFHRVKSESRAFRNQMDTAERVGEWRGVGPLPFSLGMKSDKEFLLAGDAAAVGDPFAGEGNGRALGAGPMLHAAIKKSAEGRSLNAVYRQMWKSAYSSRFKWGFLSRGLMNVPWLFSFLAQRGLGNAELVRRATPLFHSGFLVKVGSTHGG